MTQRMDLNKIDPAAYKAMFGLEKYLAESGLSKTLLHLIKIRASQINSCAFCIDLHAKQARHQGETEQRIYALNAWRETPFFTPEEHAVLALTEAVTLIAENRISEAIYEEICRYFAPNQVAQILMAIVTINAWNRIAITTQVIPGSYRVPQVV